MRRALVFGGSGQIGWPLLDRLHDAGWQVVAVSRTPRNDQPGLHWIEGDLEDASGLPREVDAIFSCGPLDHFARWYARAGIETARVLAFGSTSIEVKRGSADPAERALAQRLREGERGVFETAAARGANATLLRPTLVYGSGRDQTLTRIATLAREWGRFVLPRNACGLRQPVHVGDLAVTDGEGMTSFAVGPTYWVGSLPVWMRIAYWFSQRPILMAASGLLTLAISDLNAEMAAAFDWEHRDPWDRILAAQARLEHCTFVSTDVVFDAVLHERVW